MSAGLLSGHLKRPDRRTDQTDQPVGDWKFRLLGSLADSGALRVFTAAEFHNLVLRYRPGASASTARLLANSLVQAGALRRVASGAYLNRRCLPPAELTEMATRIRTGAVISLQSVLGECGFLNNPSSIVMAVVPTSAGKRPNLGEVKTSGGDVFRFFGLAERFFPATEEDRWTLYQPGRLCDMFRPEAALLQWLHLAGMKRSTVTPPPADVDMGQLDEEHLCLLAQRWRLQTELTTWHDYAKSVGFGEERHGSHAAVSEKPQAAADADGAAARERLLARLGKSR
ncbi:hypothetical protein [Roseateles sp.]|uniref:hypothetical protein n=1 Tax=Roseateles sp. TaxID=1971397 RepID=UPI002600C996|nr:hypothetical protein [Roseateles sp.]MBV8034588.1 hypothetical protein [Roseateles sp.]